MKQKSKYAEKQKRKCGSGTVNPAWKSWLQGEIPRPMGAPRPQVKPSWYDGVVAAFRADGAL